MLFSQFYLNKGTKLNRVTNEKYRYGIKWASYSFIEGGRAVKSVVYPENVTFEDSSIVAIWELPFLTFCHHLPVTFSQLLRFDDDDNALMLFVLYTALICAAYVQIQ